MTSFDAEIAASDHRSIKTIIQRQTQPTETDCIAETLLTQLNVYSPMKQTRDTEIIQQMHSRLPEKPNPIYAIYWAIKTASEHY